MNERRAVKEAKSKAGFGSKNFRFPFLYLEDLLQVLNDIYIYIV